MKCTQVISDYFIHSFVAVFIVADIFMCSIDAITSKTKVYIVFSSYSVASLKWKKYCLFCRKLLYQAQTAPRKRLKFRFGMELRPISFWCPLGQGIFFVVFVFCVFFHVCNSTAANIIIIPLTPNWLICFPCDRIDMLIHIIISKYLLQFVLWFPVFLLTF